MMWAYLILAAVIATPLVIEATRKRMNAAARSEAPGQFAELPDGVTHYQWWGPENGPVAVCIHGLTTPSFVWRGIAQGLSQIGFRVLTYDLYGRGYSDRPKGRQDVAFFRRQLSELLDDQRIDDDITVVGYSMGGAIAAAFAAAEAVAIRQVVLLAPAGMTDLSGGFFRRMMTLPVVGTWMALEFYPNILRRGIAAERSQPGASQRIADLQEAEINWRGFIPAVASSLRGILREDLRPFHETLQKEGVPVMAIWGRQDDVIPITAADRLIDWNPTVQTVILDDAGHGLTYTHVTTVLDHIHEFTHQSG
ncbi:alpha/beta fold hydrolase [uncultured Roseobacter sp.]|uniref:alpha/beta fold hydrolase n=1 Tax=uncultured Roseobacter sp. TaxID=114847 RepID=UPI0026069FBC|nr:alpha/beta fold hydrolase [uncultured Roseobacter sp.]